MKASARLATPKKRSNAKTKMAEYAKRARNGMRGFTFLWVDEDPFSESAAITDARVTHKNPTQRLICQDVWKRCSHWILSTEFTWVVFMDVVFTAPNKASADLKIEEGEFRITGALRKDGDTRLNDAMREFLEEARALNDQLPEGHKNKGEYLYCRFQATVEGV